MRQASQHERADTARDLCMAPQPCLLPGVCGYHLGQPLLEQLHGTAFAFSTKTGAWCVLTRPVPRPGVSGQGESAAPYGKERIVVCLLWPPHHSGVSAITVTTSQPGMLVYIDFV
jgi:hypothetical protein